MTVQSTEVERPKRMWGAVLAATAVGAIGACTFAALSGDEITDPARFREMGADWASGQEAQFAFAIPAVAALATWLVFLVLIFRKHKVWKSILALLIMVAVVTLFAVPARLITFTGHVSADDEALRVWQEEARGRIRALRAPLFDEQGDVRLTRGLEMPSSEGDVDHLLAEVRDARTGTAPDNSACISKV